MQQFKFHFFLQFSLCCTEYDEAHEIVLMENEAKKKEKQTFLDTDTQLYTL